MFGAFDRIFLLPCKKTQFIHMLTANSQNISKQTRTMNTAKNWDF